MYKKYFAYVSLIILGMGTISKLAMSMPVRAATEIDAVQQVEIPGNSSMETVWNPVALTSNSLTNYYFSQGNTTVFLGTIANYNYNTPKTVTITFNIYDQQHHQVDQAVFSNISFQPFEQKNFSFQSPSNLAPGMYYYAVGVYQAGSNNLIGWYPGYQWFTVAQ
jgi:hypothetical protein